MYIYTGGSATVSGTTFSDCSASTAGDGDATGGAMHLEGSLVFEGGSISQGGSPKTYIHTSS